MIESEAGSAELALRRLIQAMQALHSLPNFKYSLVVRITFNHTRGVKVLSGESYGKLLWHLYNVPVPLSFEQASSKRFSWDNNIFSMR